MFFIAREMKRVVHQLQHAYKTALNEKPKSRFVSSQAEERVKSAHRQLKILVPMQRAFANFEQNAKSPKKRLEWAKTYEKMRADLEKNIRRDTHYSFSGDPSVMYPTLANFQFPTFPRLSAGSVDVVDGKTLIEIFEDEMTQLKGKKKKVQYLTQKLMASLSEDQKKTIRDLAALNDAASVSIVCRNMGE